MKPDELRERRERWHAMVLVRAAGRCQVCDGKRRLFGHHIIAQQELRRAAKRLGVEDQVLLWDVDNGLAVCGDCHASHHAALRNGRPWRIPLDKVPMEGREFAYAVELGHYLDRYYSA